MVKNKMVKNNIVKNKMAKNKTILILTQPLHFNYGGLLQAYALQKFLRLHGYNAVTEDNVVLYPNKRRAWYAKLRLFVRNIIKYNDKKYPLTPQAKRIIGQHTHKFVQQHIQTTFPSSSITKKDILEQYNPSIFIVGSDQVWRPRYSPYIYNYFLDFTASLKDVKRIAYAASFGVDSWEFTEEATLRCSELIQQFDAISVREQSGVHLCKQYLNADAQWVMDPVFILPKQYYVDLIKDRDLRIQPRIFTHFLDPSEQKQQVANTIQADTGWDCYSILPKSSYSTVGMKGIQDCIFPAVEDFLYAIYTAELVITDSFHVTAFSILFNKPFLVIPNPTRGVSRLQSLLRIFGLENRLLSNADAYEKVQNETIDYTHVNNVLATKIEESTAFLLQALG